MSKDVIIALDFDTREKTLAFLEQFTEEKPFVKIGMELYYAEGPAIVREIKARGHKIFLDLKLLEIKPGELDRRLESWLDSIDRIGYVTEPDKIVFHE